MQKQNIHPYYFVQLSGSPYQIGAQQAETINRIPPLKAFFTSNQAEWSKTWYAEVEALYQAACPGLLEEIQGLADGLKVSPEQIIYHNHTYLIPPHCSHFALLPSITANRHTLVGRSYEFGHEAEDKRLCLTRPTGKHAHIGFSCLLLGRLDGLNDRGLVVTMSSGGIPASNQPGMMPPIQKGLQFWAVVRSVLENCGDVEEGINWLKQIPCGGNPIIVLADRDGHAAKVEIHGPQIAVQQIDSGSPEQYVWATNHFTSPDLQRFSNPPMRNSLTRRQRIDEMVGHIKPAVAKEDIRSLLSTMNPEGLCHHFYKEYFGTMYGFVADPVDGTLDVCFGSPATNPTWTTFTLDEQTAFKMFEAELPQADGFAEFWGS